MMKAKYDEYGYIAELDENEIFIFGSNDQGAHFGGVWLEVFVTSGL